MSAPPATADAVRVALDRLADVPPPPSGGPCQRAPGLWWSRSRLERAAAADMCRTACPVLDACRRLAHATGACDGVWAGVDLDDLTYDANPFISANGRTATRLKDDAA